MIVDFNISDAAFVLVDDDHMEILDNNTHVLSVFDFVEKTDYRKVTATLVKCIFGVKHIRREVIRSDKFLALIEKSRRMILIALPVSVDNLLLSWPSGARYSLKGWESVGNFLDYIS
jgi:hypothetical protein